VRLLAGSIEEVEHGNLGLVSSRCVHSVLELLLVAHLDLGIIVEDYAAPDKLALGASHEVNTGGVEILRLCTNEELPDCHFTSCNGASLACADDIGVGKVLSGCHFLN